MADRVDHRNNRDFRTTIYTMTKQLTITIEQARKLFGQNSYIDEALLNAFTKEELTEPPKGKRWEDLGKVSGWWVSGYASVLNEVGPLKASKDQRNIYKTKAQALAYGIVMAQLTQLIHEYREGWVPDWENHEMPKHCIDFTGGDGLFTYEVRVTKHPICFQSKEVAERFVAANEDLLQTYYAAM